MTKFRQVCELDVKSREACKFSVKYQKFSTEVDKMIKDGSGAGSGRISTDFGFAGFGFGF